MVPSYRCTSLRASSKNLFSKVCMCSGPRRSARGVEFARSQKNTVTCFRSPSRALREVRIFSARCLARIIHQPEKSTREGPFGGQMILNTTVCQEHHDPKASSSDGLGSVRIGLSVAIRHTSAWQPPRADNHRFALELSDVSIALTGPATSDVHPLTTLNSASIPAPPGTTRAMQS